MKKLLILAAIAGGYYWYTTKKDTAKSSGDMLLTQPRQLTDDEAQKYIEMYSDLKTAFTTDKGWLANGTAIENAKYHWFNKGFYENRTAPYLLVG